MGKLVPYRVNIMTLVLLLSTLLQASPFTDTIISTESRFTHTEPNTSPLAERCCPHLSGSSLLVPLLPGFAQQSALPSAGRRLLGSLQLPLGLHIWAGSDCQRAGRTLVREHCRNQIHQPIRQSLWKVSVL